MPFSDDDLEAFYRDIESRTAADSVSRRPPKQRAVPVRPPDRPAGETRSDDRSFTDDDLEAFYRDVESRTAARRPSRPRRRGVRSATPSCPTPQKVAFAAENLARDGIADVRRHTGPDVTLRCYQCVCGAWHITSKPAI